MPTHHDSGEPPRTLPPRQQAITAGGELMPAHAPRQDAPDFHPLPIGRIAVIQNSDRLLLASATLTGAHDALRLALDIGEGDALLMAISRCRLALSMLNDVAREARS